MAKDKKMTATSDTVKIGDATLTVHSDEMNFTVPGADKIKPEQAHRAGDKYKKSFTYPQVGSEDEAVEVCKAKDWSLVEFVNDALKNAARSSAYQSELALFKPTEVSAEDIKERMIRDFIRLGQSEEVARRKVDEILAA